MIYRFSVHTIRMAVPPHHATGVRTELLRSTLRGEFDRSSALLTQDGAFICSTTQSVPAAEGRHSILGDAKGAADLHVTLALAPKDGNSRSLFTGQINHLLAVPRK